MRLYSLSILLLALSFNALALDNYRCENSDAKLSYEGVDIPLDNPNYLDGSVLGQVVVTLNYDCQTANTTYTSATGRIGIAYPTQTINSTTPGIKLRGRDFTSNSVSGRNGTVIMRFNNQQHPSGRYKGTVKKILFDVIKSGEVEYTQNKDGINLWGSGQFEIWNYLWLGGPPEYRDITFNKAHSQTNTIPVYLASCTISHPSSVVLPTLIKNVRHEVKSDFNIALNCPNKSVMENNITLNVTPANINNTTLSSDKSTLTYNDGKTHVTMNIFNSVGGSKTQMFFSNKYQFVNDTESSSFIIPMHANFQVVPTSDYGDFTFQTQISVEYN
jgi:hypothetical protein